MKTQLVHFRRDVAHGLAPPDSPLGSQADGSIICAIKDCPDALPPERLLDRLKGLFPSSSVSSVSFSDLPARDGGCCGGHCGG